MAGSMGQFVRQVILRDSQTMPELRKIWDNARHNGIDAVSLCAWIDSIANEIDRAQTLTFMRWNILNSKEHMNPVARGSFAAEVAYLKEFVAKRVEWMDKRLGYTYVPADPADVQSPTLQSQLPVAVWDVMGRMIYTGKEMPQLQPGMYIIQENGKTEIKLIQ